VEANVAVPLAVGVRLGHEPRGASGQVGVGHRVEDLLGVRGVREVLFVRTRDVEEEAGIAVRGGRRAAVGGRVGAVVRVAVARRRVVSTAVARVQRVDDPAAELAAAEAAERSGVDPRRCEREPVAVVDRERLDERPGLDAQIERLAVVSEETGGERERGDIGVTPDEVVDDDEH